MRTDIRQFICMVILVCMILAQAVPSHFVVAIGLMIPFLFPKDCGQFLGWMRKK